MANANKVCGTCIHVRLTLGIVTSLDFKAKLKTILQRITNQSRKTAEISLDNDLFEVLAFLNHRLKIEMTRQNDGLVIALHPAKTFRHAENTPAKSPQKRGQ